MWKKDYDRGYSGDLLVSIYLKPWKMLIIGGNRLKVS